MDDQIAQFDKCLLTSTTTRPDCNYEFIGWDDRTGIGGSNPMAAGGEPYRAFNSLVVRAVRELARPANPFSRPALCGAHSGHATGPSRGVSLSLR